MAKLWDKGYEIDPEIERFTVGEDHRLDRALVRADVLGSMAHATMLAAVGLLSAEERDRLLGGLKAVLQAQDAGTFAIRPEQEDVHTAVEEYLTDRLGDLGKKLHTGRSRNDQVLLDLRLWGKEQLHALAARAVALVRALAAFARANEFVPMPGRTHTQLAMPSSLGLWAGAWAEAVLDASRRSGPARPTAPPCRWTGRWWPTCSASPGSRTTSSTAPTRAGRRNWLPCRRARPS